MISVSTNFHPFRLKLSRREPVEFTVLLKNKSTEPRMITYEMVVSNDLSLDKSGLKYGDMKQIEKFMPGEEKKYSYDVYAKQFANIGEIPIKIKITQHYKNFKYIEKEYIKDAHLTVEE
ncbi:MAG: hypothetical protein JW703_01015 [Candidatus Diapherotrites archaeon]|nr:hypothetical protein [Candidatus Diapherotrites archaeon]